MHYSSFDPRSEILETALRGTVDQAAVQAWADDLRFLVSRLPSGANFKLLLDLHGYEPADVAAHRAMREVVPDLLVACGLRPAFADLFPEAGEVRMPAAPRVRCTAFANVHHEAAKMERYEREIARPEQRFFTDREPALQWLRSR